MNIEALVGEYLRLPYRAPEIDRLLVDLLIAMEFVAFLRERPRGFWRSPHKDLIDAMLHCYNAMDSNGPISAHHVREWLAISTAKGAVWPAPSTR